MSQFQLNIDGAADRGPDLITKLNLWSDAQLSTQRGPARPAFAARGLIWLQELDPDTLVLHMFDGSVDVEIGRIDTRPGGGWTPAQSQASTDAPGAVELATQAEGLEAVAPSETLAPPVAVVRAMIAAIAPPEAAAAAAVAGVVSLDAIAGIADARAAAALDGFSGGYNPAAAPVDTQQFDSSGVWNKPGGVPAGALVRVRAWGGGGAGGGAQGSGRQGGGGAGGEYAERVFTVAALGASETVTVGGGGAGASAGGGGRGGDSAFGAHLTAPGGSGGAAATTELQAAGAPGGTGGGGGRGGRPGGSASRGGGGGAGGAGDAGGVSGEAGAGGSMFLSSFSSANGAAGAAPAGGGAGGQASNNTARSGGAGAVGRVIVEVF